MHQASTRNEVRTDVLSFPPPPFFLSILIRRMTFFICPDVSVASKSRGPREQGSMQVWVNLVRANGFDPKKIPGRRKLFNEVGVELNPPDFDHRVHGLRLFVVFGPLPLPIGYALPSTVLINRTFCSTFTGFRKGD